MDVQLDVDGGSVLPARDDQVDSNGIGQQHDEKQEHTQEMPLPLSVDTSLVVMNAVRVEDEKSPTMSEALQNMLRLQKSRVLRLWRKWANTNKENRNMSNGEEDGDDDDDGDLMDDVDDDEEEEAKEDTGIQEQHQQQNHEKKMDLDKQQEEGKEPSLMNKRSPTPIEDDSGVERKKIKVEDRKRKKLITLGGCLLTETDLKRHVENVAYGIDNYRGSLMLIFRKLYEHRMNKGMFNAPVNPVALGLPTYFDVIKKPMDLGTIKNKMERDEYIDPMDFVEDVRLVYNNALTFNPPKTYVHQSAKKALKLFEVEYGKLKKELDAKDQAMKLHSCDKCHGESCELCGSKCIELEEPVLRCSAPCKARIQRNAVYYRLGGERGQHWCNRCYTGLADTFIGILGQVVHKADLECMIHNQIFFEPWVDCARCHRRLHQICTLYSPSINPNNFVCAICVADINNIQINDKHIKRGIRVASSPSAMSSSTSPRPGSIISDSVDRPWARSLPHTEMGKFLENQVREAVRGHPIGTEELASSFTLRVVSSRECVTKYEPRIMRWVEAQRKSCGDAYTGEILHSEFPCKTKTVLLFQKIDGIDVILFVLYVQEYGADCPKPNRNKVYISYLDSVCYMNPPDLRTVVYQRILTAYFRWVNARGFEHTYIWACPPQRGDAYIMYCHPKWQRTPGADRLRKWYQDLVKTSMDEGVIMQMDDMYNAHLSHIKPLVNTRQSRSRGGRSSTSKPNGQHHESLLSPESESLMDTFSSVPRKIAHPFEEMPYFYGDYLPNEIEGMLTMLLSPKIYRDPKLYLTCDESIRAWWNVVWGSETKAELLNSPVHTRRQPSDGPVGDAEDSNNGENVVAPVAAPMWKLGPTADLDSVDLQTGFASPQQRNDWLMGKLAACIKPMSENFFVLTHTSVKRKAEQQNSGEPVITNLNGTILTSDTSDPDPILPPGIFDTRLEFLDMCKHNHFQFDQLRRAKHSSLLLLYYHRRALKQGLRTGRTPIKKSNS